MESTYETTPRAAKRRLHDDSANPASRNMHVNGSSHCRHFDESLLTFFPLRYGSAPFLTTYLCRPVVHVSELKKWKIEPISQKASPMPAQARCTEKLMHKSCIVNCIRGMQKSLLTSHHYA